MLQSIEFVMLRKYGGSKPAVENSAQEQQTRKTARGMKKIKITRRRRVQEDIAGDEDILQECGVALLSSENSNSGDLPPGPGPLQTKDTNLLPTIAPSPQISPVVCGRSYKPGRSVHPKCADYYASHLYGCQSGG